MKALEIKNLNKIYDNNLIALDNVSLNVDKGDFYACPIEAEFRSTMNVPFRLKTEDLERTFLEKAEERGMFNLKGHRSVGGMRASIYNAVPVSWVDELVSFMNDFENEHG